MQRLGIVESPVGPHSIEYSCARGVWPCAANCIVAKGVVLQGAAIQVPIRETDVRAQLAAGLALDYGFDERMYGLCCILAA